jgi:hypothetical protein
LADFFWWGKHLFPPPPCLWINDDWIEEEDGVVLCDGEAVDVGQLGGGEGSDHLKMKKNSDAMSSIYSCSTGILEQQLQSKQTEAIQSENRRY